MNQGEHYGEEEEMVDEALLELSYGDVNINGGNYRVSF